MKTISDNELFDTMKKELFSCVIGDVMDHMGFAHQYLPPHIRPLKEEYVVCGRAFTVQEADVCGTQNAHKNKDEAFGVMFEALDSLSENEIYVCTGSSANYACWGELMSTRAMLLKAVGAVVEGYSRDTMGIYKLGFPTFSMGPYGQDQGIRGRVIDFQCPIEFSNKVRVEPGDIVFGDIDGVVVIPSKIEAEVLERALEKVRGENMVAKKIREGMPTREVWDTYGIM